MRIRECHEALVGKMPEKLNFPTQGPSATIMGTFELPTDLNEAVTAGSVLAAIALSEKKVCKIVADRPELKVLVDSTEGLQLGDVNSAVSLILPPNLNGRSREEWYGRAAGHVLKDWEPIVQEARKVAEEARRAMNANSSSV